MKKFSIFLLTIIAFVGFTSCEHDDDVVFVAQPDVDGIMFLNATAESYTLTSQTSGNIAERFVWNEVDFDAPTTITYELQGSSEAGFSTFDIIGTTGENNMAVKVSQMMALATAAGLDNDPDTDMPNTGEIFFRVRAYAGTDGSNGLNTTSEVMSITVVLPETVEEGPAALPMIYVTGNFATASGYDADWSPEAGVPLAASAEGKTDYEGFIYMNVDQPMYKFLPTNTGWDGDYGDAGDSDGSYTETLKQDGEVNAGTPDGTGGYFYVKANTEALTYSLKETNWGVIGNATPTGWDSDTDMTYDPATKIWSVTLDLTKQDAPDNGIKFRANDEWALNIGDTGADGTMEFNGENISVPEDGNYTITLDLSNPRMYTYTLTKN
ncbi:SusE domain-containing protein [Christiangramia aquimixticola]|uniref:SusE domain-containing protein n=1 Tax=Christiangramia aquimixticola TaxID=1697558 RepID=UPI003AA835C4